MTATIVTATARDPAPSAALSAALSATPSVTRLYTPEVLALATTLADFPLDAEMRTASARSARCGSSLRLGLICDASGKITRVGITAHACAIGQVAAALFARAALGRDRADITQAEANIARWLGDAAGQGDAASLPLPDWPGFAAIAAAGAFPARHDAILLAWRAAITVLAAKDASGTSSHGSIMSRSSYVS